MDLVHIVAVCILSVLFVWILYNVPILAVGVRHLRRSGRKGRKTLPLGREKLPMVSIVVPVRDEERVVGRLLEALLRPDYPKERREIIVVEDGSVDKTVEICREYARQYPDQIRLLHQLTSNGKPSALNYALEYVTGEIVGVFDADNVPEPNALLKAVAYFEDSSVAAVQGRTCAINAGENMLTRFTSYEETVRYEAYIGGKDVLDLFVPFTGSCYFIRRNILDEVGGWDGESLSEDTELAARLTEGGYRIKYASDVRSCQENLANLTQFFRQQARWFRGCMEVSLKSGRLVKRLDRRCIDAEITLVGPFIFVPCLLSYLVTLYSLLVPLRPDTMSTIMANAASMLIVFLLSIIGIALTYATKPRKISNMLWLPFIYAYWTIQNFVALYALMQIVLRMPRRWVKTIKTGATTNHGTKM